MSEHVFTQKPVWFDGLALAANLSECRLAIGNEVQDITNLLSTSRERLGGLDDVAFSAAGYFDAADPDSTLFAAVSVSDSLITVAADTALGSVAFFLRALLGDYAPIQGAVGEPHGFELNAGAYAGDLYRGLLMQNEEQTATGNGTGQQLGAVSATQSIRLALHVVAVTGDWDVVVESDDNAGFTTATTRITEAAITAVGGYFQALAGAITDDYWRCRFVENSAGAITLAAALSIQ